MKHAKCISSDDIEIATEENLGRGGADAVIVTGQTTGRATPLDRVDRAKLSAKKVKAPVYIGSGATRENIEEIAQHTHSVIVGSEIKKNGIAGNPLDLKRAKAFVKAYKSAIKKKPKTIKKKKMPRKKKK